MFYWRRDRVVIPIEPPSGHAADRPRHAMFRRAIDRSKRLPVGNQLLGRVVDGNGRPLDQLGPLDAKQSRSAQQSAVQPLQRAPIRNAGRRHSRALNGFIDVGRGQRLGLFAGSGVGKSCCWGMMAAIGRRS